MTAPSESEAFWEDRYSDASAETSGRPSTVLVRYAEARKPGRALELGCGKGDDAVWLARRGWTVTAVDVSATVLGIARANAERAGVAGRITFARHDLSQSFPEGEFDMVCAMFLESPVEFGRANALRRAASAILPGGLLLVATHGSAPPWRSGNPDHVFVTADEVLAGIALDLSGWNTIQVGPVTRQSTGPEGQTADVIDHLVILERR